MNWAKILVSFSVNNERFSFSDTEVFDGSLFSVFRFCRCRNILWFPILMFWCFHILPRWKYLLVPYSHVLMFLWRYRNILWFPILTFWCFHILPRWKCLMVSYSHDLKLLWRYRNSQRTAWYFLNLGTILQINVWFISFSPKMSYSILSFVYRIHFDCPFNLNRKFHSCHLIFVLAWFHY
jgi:hypothetical protein